MLLRNVLVVLVFFACQISNTSVAQQAKLVLPLGHTQVVNSAMFSPDGKMVVTASSDATAKIWDVASGKLLTDLLGHTSKVSTAVFSPDGKWVVTASEDSTAKIWDAVTGGLLHDLTGHHRKVLSAQFSADGSKVVTASGDGTAIIWDVATGQPLRTLTGHGGAINTAVFSSDNSKIVTASDDLTAIEWDATTGDSLHVLKSHRSFVASAQFSPDGKKIVTASNDKTAIIWDALTGAALDTLAGHVQPVVSAIFSPDGTKILTISKDRNAKIWDAETGAIRVTYSKHRDIINSACFGAGSDEIVTASSDRSIKVWDISGNTIQDIKEHKASVNYAAFSPNGKKIVSASADRTAKIFDKDSGNLLHDLTGHSAALETATYSPDGSKIITTTDDNYTRVWDVATGALLVSIKGLPNTVLTANFSPATTEDSLGGKKIVSSCGDTAKVWDSETGAVLLNLTQHKKQVVSARFSNDATKIITASVDGTAIVWNAAQGTAVTVLNLFKNSVEDAQLAQFSPDGNKIVSIADANKAVVWDALTGKPLDTLAGHTKKIYAVSFSPNGEKILTASWDASAKLWNAKTGHLDTTFKNNFGHTYAVVSACFSPKTVDDTAGGKYVATASKDKTAKLWNANSGEMIAGLNGHNNTVNFVCFSPDGKKLVTASDDKTAKIWEIPSGNLLHTLMGHGGVIRTANFSPDGKTIVTASQDGMAKTWNSETGELLYTFFAVDSTDYLLVDKDNRYDGSEAARKLLYFTCASEVIGLDQVKDQLWVPKLGERIIKGEKIQTKTLADLQLCGLIPLIDDVSVDSVYHFKITTRRAALGETVLYVNGIEARRYQPEELIKNNNQYDLFIQPSSLDSFFIIGEKNSVSVKAFTEDNMISSRGPKVIFDTKRPAAFYPNLYAVIIGVSNYKGDSLDLKFAAKDAIDISAAISNSAKKLLNKDGKEHVFMYNLTTNDSATQFPSKQTIQKYIADIGAKATANDILLFFFAGHGIMSGPDEKKQFYFLTADASSFAAGPLPVVGISTAELTEWIRPQNIKAQKRILIFDACNSGGAINDIIENRNGGQDLVTARGQQESQQIKIIDKLNEQSGLFILSASASTQSAYEMNKYSQGFLTYSLLKAIKQQPDILESNKYLDVSRWFNAAEKTVKELARAIGRQQDPQLVSNTNFNIGEVDKEVISKIILPKEKPLITNCSFQNRDEDIMSDNLSLAELTDVELSNISSGDNKPAFLYIDKYKNPDAYKLIGRYSIVGEDISLTMYIVKNDPVTQKETRQKMELKGSTTNRGDLAARIAAAAAGWIGENSR